MIKKIKYTTKILLFLLITSCSTPDDVYHKLTQEAKKLLIYNEGDTFKLKNEVTNEIITYSVLRKYYDYVDDDPGIMHMSFGPTSDVLYEIGIIEFIDDDNCRGWIKLKAERNNKYTFQISYDECLNYKTYFDIKHYGLTEVNGVE